MNCWYEQLKFCLCHPIFWVELGRLQRRTFKFVVRLVDEHCFTCTLFDSKICLALTGGSKKERRERWEKAQI